MVNFSKIFDFFLQKLCYGREPIKGRVYQLWVHPLNFKVILRNSPRSSKEICFLIPTKTIGSFLVLDSETDKPLWQKWIKVLFSDGDETGIGWLPYHEFSRSIRPYWSWEEEKNL